MNGSSPSAAAATRAAAQRPSRSPGRRGVTLVELMVVMVILSILASLTLSGLAVARTRARETKTQATIRKLSEVILPFYEEYETRRPQLDAIAVARISASGSRLNREQLAGYKRVALRRLMALELPDRVSDIFPTGQPDISTPLPTSDPRVDGQSTPLVEVPPVTRRYRSLVSGADNVTSADLLHLIVTRGVVADPDMNAHFREDEMKDTNGNGLKEFVDGWGNPIMFQRWPVGFASPLQPVTGSLTDVEPLVSTRGHRLVPLIFSAGRDGAYDIMVDAPSGADEWRYAATPEPYDPFDATLRAAGGAGQQPLQGEVFLVPSAAGGVETFVALRFDGSGLPAGAFQTAGSPRDTGSRETGTPDGKLQSADNIHNHDLRQ